MTRDDQKRLERIVLLVREEVPELRLINTQEVGWGRWLFRLLRAFKPIVGEGFTTVIGPRVYLPQDPDTLDSSVLAATLAHEFVHQLDQREFGWWFYVSYVLLPLPLWRTHRAYWERRAYAVDMMLAHAERGDLGLAFVEARLRGVFSGPSYGWMWGGRLAAATYLKPVADSIRAGTLQKTAPYEAILAAWRG